MEAVLQSRAHSASGLIQSLQQGDCYSMGNPELEPSGSAAFSSLAQDADTLSVYCFKSLSFGLIHFTLNSWLIPHGF